MYIQLQWIKNVRLKQYEEWGMSRLMVSENVMREEKKKDVDINKIMAIVVD